MYGLMKEAEGCPLPDFKPHYKAMIIKTIWNFFKKTTHIPRKVTKSIQISYTHKNLSLEEKFYMITRSNTTMEE